LVDEEMEGVIKVRIHAALMTERIAIVDLLIRQAAELGACARRNAEDRRRRDILQFAADELYKAAIAVRERP
jgi:hypothetical protein